MNNFEKALKHLDLIEQNLNNQAAEITEKDNRNAYLHQLFQGTAKIFTKQHNYVEQLKKDLEQEKAKKATSEETATHLSEDIKRLEEQKQELDQRIKELNEEEKKTKQVRDKELQDLRNQVARGLKENNELKKLITDQSNRLKNAIKVDKQVFDILGEYSSKTTLIEKASQIVNAISTMNNTIMLPFTSYDENNLKEMIKAIRFYCANRFSLAGNIANILEEYRKEKFSK